jgi:serpin B
MKRIFGTICICFLAFAAFAGMNDKLSIANNAFAFDLLRQIATAQPAQNIFISPYSVSTVLQMLGNGAVGQTKTEMQAALKTSGLSEQELNDSAKALNQSLQSQTSVDLDLANAIWFEKALQLKPAFTATNQSSFQAQLASVNFETPEAADTINNWASQNTRGKINNVVSFPFPAKTLLVLANAIYFKGMWATPFDKKLTQERDFNLASGIVKQTPMMQQSQKFEYEEDKDFQAVRLPYSGKRLQMVLFLPATNSSPLKLLASFKNRNWNYEIQQAFSERRGTVTFPKFKLNYSILLNDPLQALGMKQAFIPGSADFSGVAADPLFISQVLQKSYVDVNEEGTEAAAVTTVTVAGAVMMRPIPPFQMLLDRPFLFIIVDHTTQTILFMGIINDPTIH